MVGRADSTSEVGASHGGQLQCAVGARVLALSRDPSQEVENPLFAGTHLHAQVPVSFKTGLSRRLDT